MNKPWLAEHTINPEQAADLIGHQFPQLAPVTTRLIGEGWDNLAYMINERYVFRFPRRKVAVELMENEIRLLPFVQGKIKLQIPVPQFVGEPSNAYPWPFAGYAYLAGRESCDAHLSHDNLCRNAPILAEFLKTLHYIPVAEAEHLGVTYDKRDRVHPSTRLPMIHNNLAAIEALDLYDISVFADYVASLQHLPFEARKTLTHGDIHMRHLLVDDTQTICAIIDWGDAELGHPAVDLSIVHSFLPKDAHADFFAIYGDIDNNTWELARMRALYSCSMMAVYAYDIKHQSVLQESLRGLDFVAEGLS